MEQRVVSGTASPLTGTTDDGAPRRNSTLPSYQKESMLLPRAYQSEACLSIQGNIECFLPSFPDDKKFGTSVMVKARLFVDSKLALYSFLPYWCLGRRCRFRLVFRWNVTLYSIMQSRSLIQIPCL